jgi:potassium-dependent mechanosensitive channel
MRRLLTLARGILAVLLVASSAAAGEVAKPVPAEAAAPVPSPGPSSSKATPVQAAPAPPPDSRIDTAAITARANQELGANIDQTVAGWQRDLDAVDNDLRRAHLRYTELNHLRDELHRVRAGIDDLANRLRSPLEAVKGRLQLVGAVPGAGQPPEPEHVAKERAELNYHAGLLSAAEAAVNSGRLRIDHLAETIQDLRRKNFTSNLLQPIPGLYSYETWASLPHRVPDAIERLRNLVMGWWNSVGDHTEIYRIAIETLLLCLLLTVVRWWAVPRLRLWRDPDEPPFWRRAYSAAGVILFRSIPVAVPTIFLYTRVAATQNVPDRLDWLFYFAMQSVVIIFTVNALTTTALSPRARGWRLVAASDRAAARICALALLLAVTYAVTNLAYVATRVVQAPFALTIAIALPSSLVLVGIIVAILLTKPEGHPEEGSPSLRWLKLLRMAVWAVIVAIVLCTVSGYLALARFLTQQLIVTGSILAVVYLLLLWVDGFTQALTDDGALLGRWLKEKVGLEQSRRQQLSPPLGLFLKGSVLIVAVPLIMLQWGYSWPDIRDWYNQLFFGFHIANTQVSVAALLASVIVFALGYGAARLFQRWLDNQVLQPAGLSGGVRHSISTAAGYTGVVIAALFAFSHAGFNLSNLAIVAGALSVGIGFGLQGLVNNFVSGLILLAERPINVGDLVVVGGEEGYVRRISVRSTEIETFDRANVLVPNSYLISEKVKNWTLRNSVRRLAIGVGVVHGSDARNVRTLLLKVAQDHPDVLRSPEPFVDFEEFGQGILNFKLYVFINDIRKTVSVRTELRIAILDAFIEAGVVLASGQTDVTIANPSWLREMIVDHFGTSRVATHEGNGQGARTEVGSPAS